MLHALNTSRFCCWFMWRGRSGSADLSCGLHHPEAAQTLSFTQKAKTHFLKVALNEIEGSTVSLSGSSKAMTSSHSAWFVFVWSALTSDLCVFSRRRCTWSAASRKQRTTSERCSCPGEPTDQSDSLPAHNKLIKLCPVSRLFDDVTKACLHHFLFALLTADTADYVIRKQAPDWLSLKSGVAMSCGIL